MNNSVIGVAGVEGLPICHKAYPGEGDTDEDFNKDYVKLTETQCNTAVDFDQDGNGVEEDLSDIYYWSSPNSGPQCKNSHRLYSTALQCSEIDKNKLKPGITCENIVANYKDRSDNRLSKGGIFCKTGIPSEGDSTFCVNDDRFDVVDGTETGRCYGYLPVLGLRGRVYDDGTPIFNKQLTAKDNQYCRTRVSCDRNETTKRCNLDENGRTRLNFCENQPGNPGILTSDNPVCQNSFAVNESVDEAAALPEYTFVHGVHGDDVIKCAKNPWCDIAAPAAAALIGVSLGATAGTAGAGLSAEEATKVGALMTSWTGLNAMGQIGAAGARNTANNPSSDDLPGTNEIREGGKIKGLTCEDGLTGCGVSVNLVPEFIRQKPEASSFFDMYKDTSNCSVYWHEGNPICCDKDYTCKGCDNLI